MRSLIVLMASLAAGPVLAQTPAPAPAPQSGGGGTVGPSVSSPTQPTGITPPGTPTTNTVAGQQARDGTGQSVIGHTATPPTGLPGNTGGQGTGSK